MPLIFKINENLVIGKTKLPSRKMNTKKKNTQGEKKKIRWNKSCIEHSCAIKQKKRWGKNPSRISYKLMNMLLIKTLSAKEIHLQIENLTVTGEQQKVFS